jgi:hypothetical protein
MDPAGVPPYTLLEKMKYLWYEVTGSESKNNLRLAGQVDPLLIPLFPL